MATYAKDDTVDFAAHFVRARTKTDQRRFIAHASWLWVRLQQRRGVCGGAIMLDIDDTLIDGHERVDHGFEAMCDFVNVVSLSFPLHLVTARPKDQHDKVMALMRSRGVCVPPDRLHMLPTDLYNGPIRHVEEFKWETSKSISREHGGVLVRIGDRLWDVAHLRTLDAGTFEHVQEKDSYIFRDPALRGTLSAKLTGT